MTVPAVDQNFEIAHQDAFASSLSTLDRCLAVPSPQGLLRIGSSARGELVGRRAGASLIALGDVEYIHMAVSSSEVDSMCDRVQNARQELAGVFEDVAVSSIRGYQLRRLRHRFWLWEAIRSGSIVAGHDFRPLLPRVTIQTLDFRELNEILLWRMLKLVKSMESDILTEHLTHPCDERCFALRFHVARQILDIPTWWLPRQGVLLSGFGPRTERFTNNDAVPSAVKELVHDAWLMRQKGGDQRSCQEWVESGSNALLWADDERVRSTSHESRFSDSDFRSQATRFKFYLQRTPRHTIQEAPTLARSRAQLYRRLRPLVETLTRVQDITQDPIAWNARRAETLAFSKKHIEWISAES